VPLKYEAAVAGGIPVIKGLREGAAANAIVRIYGILNGTCNYILSTMEKSGRDFAEVLREAAGPRFMPRPIRVRHRRHRRRAQAGDPRRDRLRQPDRLRAMEITGITRIRAADIAQAAALGYVIRLIGLADCDGRRRGACSSGSSRAWSRARTRWRRSTGRPTRSSPRATSPAGCCSRAPAPATGRPRARWSPT
jgi:homoserine dehydrogenase